MIAMLEAVLRRPRSVISIMLVVLAAGIVAYQSVPKEANPDIDVPVFFVSVGQQGISPQDAERLLVRPMETHLRGLDGLKEMTAIASEGHAGIVLEFTIDFDKTRALADIRAKVDRARAELPEDANEPVVTETNFSLVPTINVAVSGPVPERTLYRLARELRTDIEAIPTVLEARLKGHREDLVEVIIDTVRLESYGITQQELLAALSANNQLVPAGFLDTGAGRFNVKVPGLLESVSDVESLPIKQHGEGVVTLADVADVRRTFKDPTIFTRVNGDPAISIEVVKRLGTNVIDNNQAVRAAVAEATRDWPETVSVNFLLDQSTFIHEVLRSLESAILTAIMLVMVVVLAALGLRSAILVGVAIPVSFMTGFLILGALGMTVNMMVMFGLVLTVGMLVDGAIVVVEYADRKIAEGMDRQEAYIRAAKLMFTPVMASTATTLAAFLPMLLWPGVAGEFMSYLPIMVIIVLSASLVTAMIFLPVTGGLTAVAAQWMAERAATLAGLAAGAAAGVASFALLKPVLEGVPMESLPLGGDWAAPAAAALLIGVAVFVVSRALFGWLAARRRPGDEPDPTARLLAAGARLDTATLPGLTGAYVRFLHGLTRSLWGNLVALAVIVAVVASIFAGFGRHSAGVEYFIEDEPNQTVVMVSARGNLSAREALALVGQVEREILQVPGIESVVAAAYPNGGSTGDNQVIGSVQDKPADRIGELNLALENYALRRPWREIEAEIRARTADLPGIRVEPRKIGGGPPTGKDINLQITSPSYERLLAITGEVRRHFETVAGLTDIEDDRPLPGIDWQLTIDRREAGRVGAGTAAVGNMIQLVTNGVLIGKYRPDDADDEVDIRVRLPEAERSLDRLDALRLVTPAGQVPLSNFVSRQAQPKVFSITRKDGVYAMSVKAGVDTSDGTTINQKVGDIQAWLAARDWPEEVRFRFRGADEEQQEAGAFLAKAMAGSLFLMFIILVTQFNSFWQTFATLFTVVLAAAGALAGMVVTGQNFSIIMTGTGIVALAGIVVNNAIVLIDTYNRMRSEGVQGEEAVLKAAAQRLRPILLTTITTIAGLIPMASQVTLDFFERTILVGGITSMWWVQLSTAVISGLAFSTVLTLVMVPVLLALPGNLGRLFTRRRKTAPAARSDLPPAAIPYPFGRRGGRRRDEERWRDLPQAAE
jgi:multidrug efflux pump